MGSVEASTLAALPATLSILPLKGRVLLPSSAMKLVLTSPRSLALVVGPYHLKSIV